MSNWMSQDRGFQDQTDVKAGQNVVFLTRVINTRLVMRMMQFGEPQLQRASEKQKQGYKIVDFLR